MVPTYGRAEYLRRCLDALEDQERIPDEVIVVVRAEDEPTRREVRSRAVWSRLKLRETLVDRPGNVLPVMVGLREVAGDVAVLTDDDAEAYPDWLKRLESHYEAKDVGGVGGSLEEYVEGRRLELPKIGRAGYLKWTGDYAGGFHRLDPSRGVFEVDFLRGANMSFRTTAWRSAGVDPVLNRADYHFEVDVGLRIRRMGLRILCDPAARVRHYNAGRTLDSVYGAPGPDLMRRRSHNFAYTMLRNLGPARSAVFLVWLWLVGNKSSWGLFYFLVRGLRVTEGDRVARLTSAFRGKWEGISSYLQIRR